MSTLCEKTRELLLLCSVNVWVVYYWITIELCHTLLPLSGLVYATTKLYYTYNARIIAQKRMIVSSLLMIMGYIVFGIVKKLPNFDNNKMYDNSILKSNI